MPELGSQTRQQSVSCFSLGKPQRCHFIARLGLH